MKLVETDNVKAVIVASSSASGLAVNALADKYQIPVVILFASHPNISKGTKFVTQICFDDNFQADVAALFVRDELLVEHVAVFKNPNSFHSSSLAEEFARKFRSIEGQVVDVESVSDIARKMSEMEWAPRVMGGDGLLSRTFAERPEDVDYLEGFFTIDLYSNRLEITSRQRCYPGFLVPDLYISSSGHF